MVLPFLIGTLMVVLMFQANQLIALYKDQNINMQRVPFTAVLQFILLKTPSWLQLTMPVGIALGASLSLSRIARESELTAMRSAGIPIRRVLIPVLIAGALGAGLNFWVTEHLMPRSEKASTRLLGEMGQLALQPTFKSNVAISLNGWIATIGTVTRGEGDTMNLTNVMLAQKDTRGEETVVMAERGSYSQGNWVFPQAVVRVFKGKDLTQIRTKSELKINQRISVENFFGGSQTQEMSIPQLRTAIKSQREAKLDTKQLEIEYHLRYSLPASCAIFAFAGAVLAVSFARNGPFVGVMLTFILVMVYYNAFVIAKEIFGRNGYLPPVVAAWAPNVVFFVLGLVMLRRAE